MKKSMKSIENFGDDLLTSGLKSPCSKNLISWSCARTPYLPKVYRSPSRPNSVLLNVSKVLDISTSQVQNLHLYLLKGSILLTLLGSIHLKAPPSLDPIQGP